MLNKTLIVSRDTLNSFTKKVFDRCASHGSTLVQLRNGNVVGVHFYAAEDETENSCFYSENWKYCWFLDGSSYKSDDLDMMMIGSQKLLSTNWQQHLPKE